MKIEKKKKLDLVHYNPESAMKVYQVAYNYFTLFIIPFWKEKVQFLVNNSDIGIL